MKILVSESVIRAVQYAKDMQLSEDVHAIFGHIVMQKLCGYM